MSGDPPILFLHGFGTSTAKTWIEPGWFELVKEGGRRAIGIDLLGHGTAVKPHDPAEYVDLAGAVLDELTLEEGQQIDIVGYSLGALTALDIAIRHPALVRRLVLSAVGRNLVGGPTTRDPEETDRIGHRFEGLYRDPDNDRLALEACSQAQAERTDRTFTAETLAAVTGPCLLVIGDQDFAGPPEPLAELLPDCEVVTLRGVDHFALPKQFGFIDAALEFLDAVPRW